MSEIISEKSLGISEHSEICKNGREILQKCPSKFINPKLKIGTARGPWGFRRVSRRGEISGEILYKDHTNSWIKGTQGSNVMYPLTTLTIGFKKRLKVVYSERGDSQLSFTPKIFDIRPSREKLWVTHCQN